VALSLSQKVRVKHREHDLSLGWAQPPPRYWLDDPAGAVYEEMNPHPYDITPAVTLHAFTLPPGGEPPETVEEGSCFEATAKSTGVEKWHHMPFQSPLLAETPAQQSTKWSPFCLLRQQTHAQIGKVNPPFHCSCHTLNGVWHLLSCAFQRGRVFLTKKET